MAEHIRKPWGVAESVPLPDHQAVFGVDMERYSDVPSSKQGAIMQLVPDLVNKALEVVGLHELLEHPRFPSIPGDGYIFGFDPRYVPTVLSSFLDELDKGLRDYNATAAYHCRLRAALHLGPLPHDGAPTDGNGDARIKLHRLLDCEQVKRVLARSDKDGTGLVAIISDQVYADVVRAGYSTIHPSCYTPVLAAVPGKGFAETGWIYVPSPSGSLLAGYMGSALAKPDVPLASATSAAPAAVQSALRSSVGDA